MFLWGSQSMMRVESAPIYLGPFTPPAAEGLEGWSCFPGWAEPPLESLLAFHPPFHALAWPRIWVLLCVHVASGLSQALARPPS